MFFTVKKIIFSIASLIYRGNQIKIDYTIDLPRKKCNLLVRGYCSQYHERIDILTFLILHFLDGNVLEEHTFPAHQIAWSPDDTRFASCSSDKSICIWNGETGKLLATWCAIEKRLTTSSWQNTEKGITKFCWSPDSSKIAWGSRDGFVRIWNGKKDKPIFICKGHAEEVSIVTWSPDSNLVVSKGADKSLRIWNASTAVCTNSIQHTGIITCLVTAPKKRKYWIAYALEVEPYGLYIWDGETKEGTHCNEVYTGKIDQLAWSHDGERIAFTNSRGFIGIWNLATKNYTISSYSNDQYDPNVCITRVAWAPNNKLASGGSNGFLHIWNGETGRLLVTCKHSSSSYIHCLAWSHDKEHSKLVSIGNTINIWDGKSDQPIAILYRGKSGHLDVAWSHEKKSRRIASSLENNTIRLWSL